MSVIKTPNPNYDGTTLGVKFNNGSAVIEDENLRKVLVNDYGYFSNENESKPEESPKVATEVTPAKAAPRPRKPSAK